jgi:hypothetical protein
VDQHSPPPISTDWHEQYERMLRSRDLLRRLSRGEVPGADSNTNRDALYHFFMDAYHLKDWIKNAEETRERRAGRCVESAVNASAPLRICADVCNGIKHLRLDPERPGPRTGDATTAITSQSVTIRLGSGDQPTTALHNWSITSEGQAYDATALADEIVNDWRHWLARERLLPDD